MQENLRNHFTQNKPTLVGECSLSHWKSAPCWPTLLSCSHRSRLTKRVTGESLRLLFPSLLPIWLIRTNFRCYLGDVIGSTRDVYSERDGLRHIDYLAFGGLATPLEDNQISGFLFAARHFDMEISSYHFRAREYSPSVGRFSSVDPLGFDASDENLYRFVRNSPANAVDPTGEYAFHCSFSPSFTPIFWRGPLLRQTLLDV